MKRIVLTIAIFLGMTFGMFAQSGSGTYAPIVLPPHGQLDDQDASFSAITQTIALSNGYNFVSANVEITLDDLKAALVAALPGTTITIYSQANGSTKYNGTRWRATGDIDSNFDLSQMYKIQVSTSSPVTISLTGAPIDPAAHPATIHGNNGYTWFAFPLQSEKHVNDAFSAFGPVKNDRIDSQGQGSTNYTGSTWRSGYNLKPGKGYIYKSVATSDKPLTFPSAK